MGFTYDSYKLKDFLADNKALLKVTRPKYFYTLEQAIKEHVELAKRADLNNIVVDEQFYCKVLTARGKVCKTDFRGLYLQNKEPASDSAVGAS